MKKLLMLTSALAMLAIIGCSQQATPTVDQPQAQASPSAAPGTPGYSGTEMLMAAGAGAVAGHMLSNRNQQQGHTVVQHAPTTVINKTIINKTVVQAPRPAAVVPRYTPPPRSYTPSRSDTSSRGRK
jgi:hypothetical protein